MAFTDNQGHQLEDRTIAVGLAGKATEAVAIRLDLVAMETTVHDRQVGAGGPAAEAKLID